MIEDTTGSKTTLSYDGLGNLIGKYSVKRDYKKEVTIEYLTNHTKTYNERYDVEESLTYFEEYNPDVVDIWQDTLLKTGYTVEELQAYEPTVTEYTYVNDLTKEYPAPLVINNENVVYGNNKLSVGESSYYYDGKNNVVITQNNEETTTYSYDPFGNSTNESYGYNSELHVDELQYLRARYYDPSTGRFIQRDTYLGELENPISQNRYTYCANNPIYYDDPSGNKIQPPHNSNGSSGNMPPDFGVFELRTEIANVVDLVTFSPSVAVNSLLTAAYVTYCYVEDHQRTLFSFEELNYSTNDPLLSVMGPISTRTLWSYGFVPSTVSYWQTDREQWEKSESIQGTQLEHCLQSYAAYLAYYTAEWLIDFFAKEIAARHEKNDTSNMCSPYWYEFEVSAYPNGIWGSPDSTYSGGRYYFNVDIVITNNNITYIANEGTGESMSQVVTKYCEEIYYVPYLEYSYSGFNGVVYE